MTIKNASKRKQAHKEQRTTKRVAKAKSPKKNAQPAEVLPLEKPAPKVGNVVNRDWKAKAKTSGGGNGDALDTAMRNAWLGADSPDEAFFSLCDENGVDSGRWMHLNHGMRRMNVGNVLRGRLKRGEKVTVRNKAIKL